jgi:TPP-dependent 2-oxoacid decarboxylase
VTATRTAIGGALALNGPGVYAATVLPPDAVAISTVALGAIGATLGAITGGAIASQPSTPAAVFHLDRRDRLAA